ncbi:MAG: serine--tRNA ligase [Candidatus Omnitrophica bacterium]|nr:serine--tRNA ligase [Candidatus Omnitrophota bacterium]
MLDLKFIRENRDLVSRGLKAKNSKFDLQELLHCDTKRRAAVQEVEELKRQRNLANDQIVSFKKSGQAIQVEEAISQMRSVSQKIDEFDKEVGGIDEKMTNLLLNIPNLPHIDVPISETPAGNKVVREWGKPKVFSFKPKEHLEIANKQGWISMERGSKISGAGFPVYLGKGARLERALINFMLDFHTKKHGYTEVWVPALVNRQSMTGTGQLPKFEEDMYQLKHEDYFLIPTAEVPITNLLRNEVLNEADLPVKYTGYTPCFRREAGSYGKDTRGLSRVHQFDKIEMVKFVKPEKGIEELELLVKDAEDILQALELPYRVLLLCSADMSFSAAKCYDLEVWAPGTQKWFEVSSCSLFTDFQARRINVKYRPSGVQNKSEYVHTLNGSGVALARTVLCLLENGQTEQGEIQFPTALEPYLDC